MYISVRRNRNKIWFSWQVRYCLIGAHSSTMSSHLKVTLSYPRVGPFVGTNLFFPPICSRSMLVSAKLSDGSVDLAFQSLLRHLLDKHVPEKKKEPQEKLDMHQSTKKMRKQDREKYLTYCGIEQVGFSSSHLLMNNLVHTNTNIQSLNCHCL